MKIETAEQQFLHDSELFKNIVRDFDRHFVQTNRAAQSKKMSFVPDFQLLVQRSIRYTHEDTILDVSDLATHVAKIDRPLFADLMRMLIEHFQGEPGGDRTLRKFKYCVEFFMRLSEFVD